MPFDFQSEDSWVENKHFYFRPLTESSETMPLLSGDAEPYQPPTLMAQGSPARSIEAMPAGMVAQKGLPAL